MTVAKDACRAFFLEKVIPSIAVKWPKPDKSVVLQHDNARAHVTPMDAQLKAAFDEYGKKDWAFSFIPQPPNSPDTNISDLCFFVAIKSLQQK
ncbi:hypothetical protein H310_09681 [Aphanomyces invadans]|uniref:Tc1-like transposase DDE domain-containing protein n=1 Tax=Aphanomyces invadans TaxID=157072 RepID=A0A024TTJ5_9STRA|nr:hypothetical protein H310_09681 [Aphanomyces invadans]ETV97344.1 hypothetical protein H310_09681 [Aphanomyces invadans]|eukprot:XP_008874052.1 hypothetical protein H310_09681 [Aphanomyces invadans]